MQGPFEFTQIEHPLSDRWITMANSIARAADGLSLLEKRLLWLALAKLDSRRQPHFMEEPKLRISAREYVEAFDADPSAAYKILREAAKGLMKRQVTFYEVNAAHSNKKKAPPELSIQWLVEAKYVESHGWIELQFYSKIVPYLMGLKKRFTTYRLQQCSELRSIYTWKLFELLKSYEKTGWMKIPIERFCNVMNIPEATRQNFAQVRRKIIEPAIKELNEKDGWLIEWRKTNYGGRRVEGLHFTFQKNPQQQLFSLEQPPEA